MQINQSYFIINIYRVLNILPILMMGISLNGFAQANKNHTIKIALHNETEKIVIGGYAVTQVQDETGDTRIGKTVSADKQTYSLTFSNGTEPSLLSFINHNYACSSPGRQIRIGIKKLLLDETITPAGAVNGKLTIQFSFDINKGGDVYAHLVEYKGAIAYTRLLARIADPEQYLREGIKNSLKFFDAWFARYKNSNPLLANSVKLVFDNYTERPEGDTIYYSPNRRLSWADFKGKPRYGIYAAEVIPGLGFTESNVIKDGVVLVEIKLKVFLPKSAAWVRRGEENDLNLNHEQRHFDIVKIVAERFKKKLQGEKLPVFNYDGYINVDYFDALREITALQKQYDLETIHGSNFAEQQRWNTIIDKELAVGGSGS